MMIRKGYPMCFVGVPHRQQAWYIEAQSPSPVDWKSAIAYEAIMTRTHVVLQDPPSSFTGLIECHITQIILMLG